MLDIKLIRTDPDAVKEGIRKRCLDLDAVVDEILSIDAARRELGSKTDALKAEQNAASKDIPRLKKEGGDVAALMARMKELSAKIKEDDAQVAELEARQRSLMLSLPNLPDADLEAGGKENNRPVRTFGEPRSFDFEPKNHVELCESLGLIDYERGAKLGGNGSWVYRGMGSRWSGLRSTILLPSI